VTLFGTRLGLYEIVTALGAQVMCIGRPCVWNSPRSVSWVEAVLAILRRWLMTTMQLAVNLAAIRREIASTADGKNSVTR
jgi:isopentenyl diphosphate isomerase/L-lactate dehydrogenase-like FMN-dependent dehydrogenase